MGVRKTKRQELQRLEEKTIDAQFLTEVKNGLGCSQFEAHAVLKVLKEIYFPLRDENETSNIVPGKITVICVCADEPSGKPIAQCQKCVVSLTLHRGAEDDRLLQEKGPAAFRQARIPDLCQEALSQGALLTREDLAYRIFTNSTRTISRDLAALRKLEPKVPIPLRSTVHDIGPMLTHRVEIVRLALTGKTMTQICEIMRHSPAAVANYLATFTRVAQLQARELSSSEIAFLLRRSRGLIDRYLELVKECRQNKDYNYHLNKMLGVGSIPPQKKIVREVRR